jgi:hypothetical protein
VHGRSSVASDVVDAAAPTVVPPDGWVFGRHVATGGSAFVYEVMKESGAPAILKWGRWRDHDIHVRFEREAEVLRTLGPPSTPRYFSHGITDGWPYVLMEHVPGETLAAWMGRSGEHGALGEIVTLLLRLANALRPLHAAGYIHRDLKPENVVIGGHDTRILDFGLAARERDGVPQDGAILGTVHYLAPEQIRTGSTIDRRADLYSFGVIAFEMIAGQPPFIGERRAIEYQHQVSKPVPLRELRPEIPQELEHVLGACLAKQPEARPQTIDQLVELLASAMSQIETIKGVGTSVKKPLAARDKVVLAWIENGDPITISHAINDVHGMLVRSRSTGILAAFAWMHHDAPLEVALAVCREIGHERCRVTIHIANVLVRRSAHGKPSLYGREIEDVASWAPGVPFTGVVLTAAAAEHAGDAVRPAQDLSGFWREVRRDRTDATEPRLEAPFVGRERLVQEVAAIASAGGMLIGISGSAGSGKTRYLATLADRLRQAKRDVISVRAPRRLLGDRPDDHELANALAAAEARGAIIVVDDAELFPRATLLPLLRDDLAVSRVIASRDPLFEVAAGVTRRLAIELPSLDFPDAERLLRHLLQPARLIPDVLLQRLALRGAGNPGLLVALARDIRSRGGVRRHAGSDDWYVAADEIDTLPGAPSAAWFATRVLDTLPVELVPVLRMSAGLGPRFCADEVSAVVGVEAKARLDLLVYDKLFTERAGWYEFGDTSLQDAIYDEILDERSLVHARALRFWLTNPSRDVVGWLARIAYHASATGELATAERCYTRLARKARDRGETELANELDARAAACLARGTTTTVADAVCVIADDW